jgi:hypothetical protein
VSNVDQATCHVIVHTFTALSNQRFDQNPSPASPPCYAALHPAPIIFTASLRPQTLLHNTSAFATQSGIVLGVQTLSP